MPIVKIKYLKSTKPKTRSSTWKVDWNKVPAYLCKEELLRLVENRRRYKRDYEKKRRKTVRDAGKAKVVKVVKVDPLDVLAMKDPMIRKGR